MIKLKIINPDDYWEIKNNFTTVSPEITVFFDDENKMIKAKNLESEMVLMKSLKFAKLDLKTTKLRCAICNSKIRVRAIGSKKVRPHFWASESHDENCEHHTNWINKPIQEKIFGGKSSKISIQEIFDTITPNDKNISGYVSKGENEVTLSKGAEPRSIGDSTEIATTVVIMFSMDYNAIKKLKIEGKIYWYDNHTNQDNRLIRACFTKSSIKEIENAIEKHENVTILVGSNKFRRTEQDINKNTKFPNITNALNPITNEEFKVEKTEEDNN